MTLQCLKLSALTTPELAMLAGQGYEDAAEALSARQRPAGEHIVGFSPERLFSLHGWLRTDARPLCEQTDVEEG